MPTTARPYLGSASRIVWPLQAVRGSAHLASAAAKLREHLDRQLLGERSDRERQQRSSSHCEHVVERIRGCDRPIVARIVNDRREEVEREDERPLVVQPIHGGVVGGRQADEEVLRLHGNEAGEQLLETGCRYLRNTIARASL